VHHRSPSDSDVALSLHPYQLPPEAGPNVFEDAAKPPEEKTSESVGPQREEDVPLASSPDGSLLRETTASVVPDTRAPVGRDAGAPEATDEAAIGGGAGWQGGAEDGPGLPKEAQQGNKHETEVAHKRVPMPEMQYDEETEEMVDQALKLDREEAIRQMEGLA
jgi:dolichyl-phosphate-mannose-protein mannosyltransferase